MAANTLELAKVAAMAAKDKKATRLTIMDLRGISDVTDVQLIVSGSSDRQTRAISDGIQAAVKQKYGINPVAIEGKQNGHWILMDYGPVMVHIFFDYLRDYYALEHLHPKAKFMQLQTKD